jgi:hypothetical protein
MNQQKQYLFGLVGLLFICSCIVTLPARAQFDTTTLKGKPFNNITLETTLKPFEKNDKAYIRTVATEMFRQWYSLLRHADTVSIMLWTGDGSEILDYRGNPRQPLEWAKYIGNPNTGHAVGSGPKELSLHERAYLYMRNPPKFTYGDLKFIIQTLKETGKRVTGKPIRVGATFDPGPEFAKSDFKYKRHREILGGNAMGNLSFVSCYSVLNADSVHYAGFPDGIPANTSFGTFFGRQSQHFLHDLGYDYIWFSNGFGFGVEGWSSTGAVFNGKGFDAKKLFDTRKKIIDFWNLFRKECPTFRIETRGTNLSTGIDLARDGVDLKEIYDGNYNILPPPNSPWAAINGDFGLEMAGYMSRIAELPDNRFMFRYYIHDPWWMNSPWFDRYGSEPYDIYLPMSVCRINKSGEVCTPTHLNFLSIDNSYGDLPTEVPDEVIPNILKARYNQPTAPGPVVWVYPFDEYFDWAYHQSGRLSEIYYGDWFMRQAINTGFPVNTVISTTAFQNVIDHNPDYFKGSILVTVAPDAGSGFAGALIKFIKKGGKVIIYGPVNHSGASFLRLLNLKNDAPLDGRFKIESAFSLDQLTKAYPDTIFHNALFSGGGLRTMVSNLKDPYTKIDVKMLQGSKKRDAVWVRKNPAWEGGEIAYVRGTNSNSFRGGQLLTPDNPEEYFLGGTYMRYVLSEFGYDYGFKKYDPAVKDPILTVAKSNNGFYFSGYVPNTTVRQSFKFPQGAPILVGYQTTLHNGLSTYYLPTAWHKECRIFVVQNGGIISCKEMPSVQKGINRRIQVTGLANATVRIYPPDNITKQMMHVYVNAGYPWKRGQTPFNLGDAKYGRNYVVKNISGELVVSW